MNLKQLEQIYKKCKEIEELRKQDPEGTYDIENTLMKLTIVVHNEIGNIITAAYWKGVSE